MFTYKQGSCKLRSGILVSVLTVVKSYIADVSS